MLAPLGHAVVEADSGRAALRGRQAQSFAVILHGRRHADPRRLRDGQAHPPAHAVAEHTPIIFLTAFGRDETETAAAYANGAVDFIFTPVLAEVLRAKVSAFVHLFLQSAGAAAARWQSITALNIEMLARLAAAAEFRDDDTGQHTRRVGNLSVAHRASASGVSELEVGLIRLAAPLHDVGKIALPDAILCKPGKLTERGVRADEDPRHRRRARCWRAARSRCSRWPSRSR